MKTTEELILEEVQDLKHRLFGNGQPGEIGSLKIRCTDLEQFKWKAVGAISVLIVLLGVVVRFYHG